MADEQDTWNAVEKYLTASVVQPDEALEAAAAASEAARLPAIAVTPNFGKLLMLLAQMLGARNILEIGTLGGYSTIWMARGLAPGGKLVTLEAEAKHVDVAQANLKRAGVDQLVELRLGKALDVLPQLAAEKRGPFDLIFIDADKEHNAEYLQWALKLSRIGSIIVVDNVVRKGTVIDLANHQPSVEGVRQANALLAAEPRLSATAIQTVGTKGYDGFAIARVIG